MQRFRRLFAFLFILSIFVGVIHEVNHSYADGETCQICIIAHSPGLLSDIPVVVFIEQYYIPYLTASIVLPFTHYIPTRSRSPPIS